MNRKQLRSKLLRPYNQNRSGLDQEAYRQGFLDGYLHGTEAAFDHLQFGEFPYTDADYYDPSWVKLLFKNEEDWKDPRKLAYQVGYHDAFVWAYRACQDTLKALDEVARS